MAKVYSALIQAVIDPSACVTRTMILNPSPWGPTAAARSHAADDALQDLGRAIVDDAGKLVGIITNRDLQFERQLDAALRTRDKDKLVTAPVGTR